MPSQTFPLVLIFSIYILVVTTVMIILGVPIYPDSYFFILLVPVLLIKRARSFIVDWLPFLFLFLSYEFLRGLSYALQQRAHYQLGFVSTEFISKVPLTIILQSHFYTPGMLHFYDYIGIILYFMHFVAPLTFAFILWIKNRQQFLRFIWGFLLLTYSGLITFIIYPTAPPWLASEKGYIGHVYKIINVVFKDFPARLHIPTIYQSFDPNPVAAIPSLHAAFPALIFLYAIRFFGFKGLILAPYVIGVWIMVIYFGEHYLFDVIIGAVYAAAAFVITERTFTSSRIAKISVSSRRFFNKLPFFK